MQRIKKVLTAYSKNKANKFLGPNCGKNDPFWDKGDFFQKLGSVTFFQA